MNVLKNRSAYSIVVIVLSAVLTVFFFLPAASLSALGFEVSVSWFSMVAGLNIGGASIPGDPANVIMLIVPLVMLIVAVFVKPHVPRNVIVIIVAVIYASVAIFAVVYFGQLADSVSIPNSAASLLGFSGKVVAGGASIFCYVSILASIAIIVLCILDLVMSRKGVRASVPATAVVSRPVVPAGSGVACANCGTVMPQNAKFCTGCGSPMQQQKASLTCSQCGASLAAGTKFCGSCGTAVVKESASVQEDVVR